jgi:hypothetical protein
MYILLTRASDNIRILVNMNEVQLLEPAPSPATGTILSFSSATQFRIVTESISDIQEMLKNYC